MVRGHHIDPAVEQGRTDLFSVLRCFDRRIPLDVGALVRVVCVGEPQVVDACLRGDALVFEFLCVVEQLQFFRRADVQNVQPGPKFVRQFSGLGRASVARLCAANQWVLSNGDMRPKTGLGCSGIRPNGGFVLTMRCHQCGGFFENAFEHRRLVHQHVASGGTHEHLDAAHP